MVTTKLCALSSQMGTLNQEVSQLTKGLHHMMHLLQAHIPLHHYKASLPSYPYGIHMMSVPTTVPTTDTSFNHSSTHHPHNNPASQEVYSLHSTPYTGHWSCSAAAQTQTETPHRPQSSSPPANSCPAPSVNSGPRLGPWHGSGQPWTSPSLLNVSPGFQGGSPGHVLHAGHENSDSRPLSASTTTISKSQPTLCLQPPSDTDDFACLLSSAPTGTSTQSLLDPSLSSYPHLCLPPDPHVNLPQAIQADMSVLVPTSACHNLIQDTSIFQIKDSHPSVLPVSASPTLSGLPGGSSLDSGSQSSGTVEPRRPLGDPSAVEHTSLECLLGNVGSMENRDSDSTSSRRPSIGVQTRSTEQSWCLDLTD